MTCHEPEKLLSMKIPGECQSRCRIHYATFIFYRALNVLQVLGII